MLVEGPHKSRHNVLRGRLRNGRIGHVSGSIQVPNHAMGSIWVGRVEDNKQDMGM